MREAKAAARATATAWRWPPDIRPTMASTSGGADLQAAQHARAWRRASAAPADSAGHAGATTGSRARGRRRSSRPASGCRRARGPGRRSRSRRRARRRASGDTGAPSTRSSPESSRCDAADAFDQRRLARAVVAEQRQHLAGATSRSTSSSASTAPKRFVSRARTASAGAVLMPRAALQDRKRSSSWPRTTSLRRRGG